MEALGEVDAVVAQQGQGLRVLDALGDRLVAESAARPTIALTTMLVGASVTQVADELDVDLQVVRREPLQVGEAAEAGAEVVEGQAAADLGEPGAKAFAGGDVLHEGGFGDLEDEVGGIRAGLAQLRVR